MIKRTLDRLKRRIDELRLAPANVTSHELVSIAKSLGRKRKKKRRGEPVYISLIFERLSPLRIPSHPGALPRFTALSVLNQFDEDVLQWEEYFDKTKTTNGKRN
jgi:hypothetical protein